MKTNIKALLLTGAAFLTIPGALLYTQHAISNLPEPERQPPEQRIPRVTVLPITATAVHAQIELFGTVRAQAQISLSSETTGRVIWRNPAFVTGGQVKKGDELIRIDATRYRSQLAEAKQQLAEARLALQQEQRQNNQARKDWQRAGISEKPDQLLLRKPQLAAAQARFEAAEATLAVAQQNLARTRIKAPFNAVVVARLVSEGSYLTSGSAIATLQSSDQAEVELALTTQQWQLLPPNPAEGTVTLHSRSQPDAHWQAYVSRLASQLNPDTRLRMLTVTVNQPLQKNPPLLPGSFVQARIEGRRLDNLFAIPTNALTADGYLWYVVENQLQRTRRSVLFTRNDQLFVSQGELPEQIKLVRQPLASYLPGMPVNAHMQVKTQPADSEGQTP